MLTQIRAGNGGNTAWITTLHYTTPLIIQYRLTDDRSTHKTNINDNIGPCHSLFLMSFCFCLLSPPPICCWLRIMKINQLDNKSFFPNGEDICRHVCIKCHNLVKNASTIVNPPCMLRQVLTVAVKSCLHTQLTVRTQQSQRSGNNKYSTELYNIWHSGIDIHTCLFPFVQHQMMWHPLGSVQNYAILF